MAKRAAIELCQEAWNEASRPFQGSRSRHTTPSRQYPRLGNPLFRARHPNEQVRIRESKGNPQTFEASCEERGWCSRDTRKTTKLWLQKENGSKNRTVRRSDSRFGDQCGINPPRKEVYPQDLKRVRVSVIRIQKPGWKGKVVKVVVEGARGTDSACPASDQGDSFLIGDENGVDTVEITQRHRTGVRNAATCQRYRVTRFSRADAILGIEWRARSRNPNVG